MSNLNWNDPEMRWLVITNWTLFAVTAICVGVALYGIGVELYRRFFQHAGAKGFDEHVALMPELGLTMADGGEKIPNKKRKAR